MGCERLCDSCSHTSCQSQFCHPQVCGGHEKLPELQRILRSKPAGTRIIIFCTTKRMCDQLCYSIAREFRAAAIHGDKRQQERDYVLAAFKSVSSGLALGYGSQISCVAASSTTSVV